MTRNRSNKLFFSRRTITTNHVTVHFNNFSVIRENFQNHLSLILDSKLNFCDHVNEKIKKVSISKGIYVIRQMNLSLSRSSPLKIFKLFVRPDLDYNDAI